jgi:acyl-CoA synthetase (AMP-forming)/AMP-acid ligase II
MVTDLETPKSTNRPKLNGVSPVLRALEAVPDRPALIFPGQAVLDFSELGRRAELYQSALKRLGLKPSDKVLLAEGLQADLYAFVLAALALGIEVAVVEPWMPLSRIEGVVRGLGPRLLLASWLGRFWGLRVPAIRQIPTWKSLSQMRALASAKTSLEVIDVDADHGGLLAFTSGTTGAPKGVARRHQYLIDQHRVLSQALHHDRFAGPELTIFTNFVFANLASQRASVVIPPAWKSRHLQWAGQLQGDLAPQTATLGPAFLQRLVKQDGYFALREVHVGGALTDCETFEAAFQRFPQSEFVHIYGSSEAEPVALMDAREAVRASRDAGHLQTLALGRPISMIDAKLEPDTAWVTGPHVCQLYVGDGEGVAEENRQNKRRDEQGRVWHKMGDRVVDRQGIWWYAGRSTQLAADFELEQRLAAKLGHSRVFLMRNASGGVLYVEGDEESLQRAWREIAESAQIVELRSCRIYRDRRHRARIDRALSVKSSRVWRKKSSLV